MSTAQLHCGLCASSMTGCTGACNNPNNGWRPAPKLGFADVVQKGCICPPASEKTCQRWDCGRKSIGDVKVTGTYSTAPNLKD